MSDAIELAGKSGASGERWASLTPGMALLKRELLTSLRRGQVFGMMGFGVLVTGLLVLSFATILMSDSAPPAQASSLLSAALCFCLYGGGLLFLPPMAAASICVEKQRDSWPLLQTSLIPASQIVFGKIVNVVGIYLLVIFAAMPLAGILFFFVGLEIAQLMRAMVTIVLSGIMVACVSVMCSAYFYRTLAAVAASFITVLFFQFGIAILIAWGGSAYGRRGLLPYLGEDVFATVCPGYSIAFTNLGGGPANVMPGYAYLIALSACAYLLAVAQVRRPPKSMRVNQRKTIDDAAILDARRKQFPFYLVDPQRRRKAIPDHRNPMLAKEIVSSLAGRATIGIRIGYLFMIFWFIPSFFIFVVSSEMNEAAAAVEWFLFWQAVMILAVAPALVANSVAKEYELGNLDMLRMTLLEPRQIIMGKLWAGFIAAMPLVCGAAAGSFLLVYRMFTHPGVALAIAHGYLLLGVTLLLCFAISLRLSVSSSTTLTSIVLSYLAILVVLVILPLVTLGFAYAFLEYVVGRNSLYHFDFDVHHLLAVLPSPYAYHFYDLTNRRWLDSDGNGIARIISLAVTAGFALALLKSAVRVMRDKKQRDR